MGLKKCPICGELFADTYKHCPFCEEDENPRKARQPKRYGYGEGGRRLARRNYEEDLPRPLYGDEDAPAAAKGGTTTLIMRTMPPAAAAAGPGTTITTITMARTAPLTAAAAAKTAITTTMTITTTAIAAAAPAMMTTMTTRAAPGSRS